MLLLKNYWVICLVALSSLFQGGCEANSFQTRPNRTNSSAFPQNHYGYSRYSLNLTNMTFEEKRKLNEFFEEYGEKSPAAEQVFKSLEELKTPIAFFEKDAEEGKLFDAGISDDSSLSLNRLMEDKGLPFDDTFFHEAEHVLHLTAAHQHGINSASFASLDDVYVYRTIMEALAYRKAALCCAEHRYGPSDFERVKARADKAFLDRMSASNKSPDERRSYEKSAVVHINSETNILANHMFFQTNPDWNEIVKIMSRGEVTEVPVLPQPTLDFLHFCILKGLEKNPNATKLSDFDLSCALAYQSELRKDEPAIKKSISNLLLETYGSCEKTDKPLSEETKYSFLYLMGWPRKKQLDAVDAGLKTFDDVIAENLSQISLKELFDGATKLIGSPDVQAYNTYKTKNYGKLLHIERQILQPESDLPDR